MSGSASFKCLECGYDWGSVWTTHKDCACPDCGSERIEEQTHERATAAPVVKEAQQDRIEHHTRNAEEGAKIVRSAPANSRFFLHARLDAYMHDDPNTYYPGAFFASVPLSRESAERFITDAFRASLTAKGCVLTIVESVGERRKRWNACKMEREEYGQPRRYFWIG